MSHQPSNPWFYDNNTAGTFASSTTWTYPSLGVGETTTSHCGVVGHKVDDDIEYVDGVIRGYCVECGDRIQLPRVAGGVSLVRVRSLLAQLPEANDSDMAILLLAEMAELKDLAQDESFALEEVYDLLSIAEEVLEQKLGFHEG